MSSARQALTIVGQVVGASFGPIGAAIGGGVGGEIGGAIDGPPQGPRLDDTSAPTLEFGSKVPRAYGTVWCTLSPRWWSALRESSEVVGGKGGDSGVDQAVYHADLLGVLCEVDLTRWPDPQWTRIRMDGEVIASRLNTSSAATRDLTAATERYSDVELFNGAATQPPWSVMEAAEGAANAIAYRGVVSVGFTNLLMPNGRRPSLVEIEIATNATLTLDERGLASTFTTLASPTVVVSEIGPDLTLINGATHTGTAGRVAGSSQTIQAVGIQGSLDGEWSFSLTLTPNGFQGSVFTLQSSTTGSYFTLTHPGVFSAFGYGIASPGNNSGGGTGGATAALGLDDAVSNTITLTQEAGLLPLNLYCNGEFIATFGNDVFAAGDMFDILVLGGGPIFGTMDYDSVSFQPVPPITVVTPGTVALRDVLESEMLRCTPLTAAHIDMSAAAGKVVHGFKAADSAAKACAVLLDWYYLDLFCADKIVVVERGGASEQTIAYGYTGSGIGGARDPFAGLLRGNDVERQLATSVSYINKLADGEVDTQTGDRIGSGSEIAQVNFSIYATPTEAKGRANTITHDVRVASHTATVALGALQAAKLQPASVLTLTDNKGNSYRVRVLRLVWNRGVYDLDVCLDDPNILTAVGIATSDNTSVINLVAPPVAAFLPLDLPKVNGENDPGYWGLIKTDTAAGARWYDSPDGVTYTPRADYANDATFGTVTVVSGSFNRGVLFDESSSLTVNVGDGTLSSATNAALLASRALNAFAVGINGRMVLGQFRTATLLSAGVYKLTGLVNMGDKGTERYCGQIVAGDKFALLGTAGTARIPRPLAQLGVALSVKGVASGRALSGVTAQTVTPNGENLKPRSPVDLRAARGAADITLTWVRRTRADTRFGGSLGDACPLDEAAEQYRVRLYTSNTYATLRRDLGVVTTTAATYTAAQISADGRALYDPVYVDVRQISDVLGEGHPLQGTA